MGILEEALERINALASKVESLEAKQAITDRVLKQNSDLVDSAEATARTGIKSLHGLKQKFTPVKKGRHYYFRLTEIETYVASQELPHAPQLYINEQAA